MDSPLGGGFMNSYPGGGAGDQVFQTLAANLLRSLQLSYVLIKGFSSTSRALKNLGNSGEGGSPTSSFEAGSGRCALRMGGNSTRSAGVFGGFRRKVTPTRTRGGKLRSSRTGSSIQNESFSSKDGAKSGRSGEAHGTAPIDKKPDELFHNGTCGSSKGLEPLCESYTGGVDEWKSWLDFRGAGDSAVASKFSSGLTSKTVFITGLGIVDGVSFNRLKPVGKGFAKGVKMASGVVKGVKTASGVLQRFSTPAGSVTIMGFGAANGVILGYEAAKFIVSSAKVSKDFWKLYSKRASDAGVKSVASKAIKDRFSRGLKVSDGALSLVKLTGEFTAGGLTSFPSSLSNWDLIRKGYEVSSGVLKVSEVALGGKGGMISFLGEGIITVKEAVSGLGVVVKTIVLTKEASVVCLKAVGFWKGAKRALEVIQEKRSPVRPTVLKAKEVSQLEILSIALSPTRRLPILITFVCNGQPLISFDKCVRHPGLLVELASLLLFHLRSPSKEDASDGRHDQSTLRLLALMLCMWTYLAERNLSGQSVPRHPASVHLDPLVISS